MGYYRASKNFVFRYDLGIVRSRQNATHFDTYQSLYPHNAYINKHAENHVNEMSGIFGVNTKFFGSTFLERKVDEGSGRVA